MGGYEYVGEYVNKKGLIVRGEDNYVLVSSWFSPWFGIFKYFFLLDKYKI
jgi:hypothetical protein